MARAYTTCDHCGQTDTDPKLHYGEETYHHDCVPFKVKRDLTTEGYWRRWNDEDGNPQVAWVDGPEIAEPHPNIARSLAIITLAEKGTRGDKLAAAIDKLHQED